jgi:hypothetical protein
VNSLLPDFSPARENPAFRRLLAGTPHKCPNRPADPLPAFIRRRPRAQSSVSVRAGG